MVCRFLVLVQMAGLVQHVKFHFGLAAQITTVLEGTNIARAAEMNRNVLNVSKIEIARLCKHVKRTNARDALAGAESDLMSDKAAYRG